MKKLMSVHTAVLVLMLAIGILAFWSMRGFRGAQLAIGIALSVAYVFWGVISHKLAGDLHKRIVVEYILVGAIAVILLITLAI